ncbi:MAG: transglutaminase-like domain-containing protein [Lachnospiraceae bacterium]
MNKRRVKKLFVMMILTLVITLGAGIVVETKTAGNRAYAATSALKKEVKNGKVSNTALKKDLDSIIKKKVKSSDSKEEKMQKLFTYVEKKYGYQRLYTTKVSKNLTGMRLYAGQMIVDGKGSCYHYAAAYAFLVKRATGYPVRICIGKTNGFNENNLQDHGWVEVKIKGTWYVFDPNMDKFAENSSGKYYMKKKDELKSVYNNYTGVKYITVKF